MTVNSEELPIYFDCNQYLPALNADDDSTWKATFESELESISTQLLAKADEPGFSTNSDCTVYSGTAGVAYFFWRLTQNPKLCSSSRFASSIESWKKIAKVAINGAVDSAESKGENGTGPGGSGGAACCVGNISRPNKCSTFLTGHAGVYAVASAIYRDIDIEESRRFTRLVMDLAPDLNGNDRLPCGIMNGITGFLCCLLFMNKHSGLNLTQSKEKMVSHQLVLHVLLRGRMLSKQNTGENVLPLLWQYRGDQHTGALMGMSGILTVLLHFHDDVRNAGYNKCMRETIEGLFGTRLESGNIPSSLNGSKADKFVQWSQGAPGFIPLLAIAMKVFPEKLDTYTKFVSETTPVIMERGLVSDSFGVCHGISGNAFALSCAFRSCKSGKYDEQAKRFALFACQPEGEDGTQLKDKLLWKSDHPYSLMEGMSGLGCLLAYFMEEEKLRSSFCNEGSPWLM